MPLVLVCEDNGLGISVPSPDRLGRRGRAASGHPLPVRRRHCTRTTSRSGRAEAVGHRAPRAAPRAAAPAHRALPRPRRHRRRDRLPQRRRDLLADRDRDPLLALAAQLRGVDLAGALRGDRRARRDPGRRARHRAVLTDAATVIAPLAPRDADAEAARRRAATAGRAHAARSADRLPEDAGPMTLAQNINAALTDALAARPETLVFGEDVGRKGGVYGLTRGLQQRFGAPRVFDTLLDEQSILGLGLGLRRERAAADPRDPVPRLPAQRRGPAARRGGEPAVLLRRRVREPDGRAHRRARLPEGLRRPLPQRRRGGGTARHPGSGRRGAGPPRGRRADAALVPGRRGRHRSGQRLPRADRALSRARPARGRRPRLARCVRRRPRSPRSAAAACTATAAT